MKGFVTINMTDDCCETPIKNKSRVFTWSGIFAGILILLVALHVLGVLRPIEQAISQTLPDRPSEALLEIVNVFTCCVLSWKALTTMLPAFLLAGAIGAFIPSTFILKYLGAGANRLVAYSVAAVSGCVLSLCSCNVVPLFTSIYRRGAGLGPAITFLYAGPAINVVAFIFTFQVIGWRLGIWRVIAVPIVGILTGLLIAFIFRHEEAKRAETVKASMAPRVAVTHQSMGRIWVMLALLLALVVYGAWEMDWQGKAMGMGVLSALLLGLLTWRFNRDEVISWGHETWSLVKMVVPILVPMLLIIGGVAAYIDIKLVHSLLGPAPEGAGFLQQLKPILIADLFGSFMYFPILSEVAFTKAFLKLGMDVGPALAVLLTGAGLSLPGLFIIARAIGWTKALTYEVIVIIITTTICWFFSSEIGQYICECMM